MPVSELAKEITEENCEMQMKIGKALLHPGGYLVKILGGGYWGEHGWSNFWYWREVDNSGKLFGPTVSGYGWC